MLAQLQRLVVAAWCWGRRYPYFFAAVPVVLALSISFLMREDSEWETVYVVAANHLRTGADIYRDGNSYPPFAALAAMPVSFLGPSLLRLTWLLVNLVCLAVMVRGAWHVAGGGPLQGARRGPLGEHLAALLGFVGGMGYLQNCLAHQQSDIVIGSLLLLGCLALSHSRSIGAATCFGIAAAMKCTALLWVPYLVWRGRPIAAMWVVVVAAGLNLLPNLVSSPPSGRLWLNEYVDRFLRPMTDKDHVVGTWGSDIIYNQSIAGAAQRWLVADRVEPVRPDVLRGVVLSVDGFLIVATLWVCGAPFRKLARHRDQGVTSEGVECAIVLLLMLLLSPMSSKAHFGILLVPAFLLARAAVLSGSRLLWCCTLLAVTLACLSPKDLLGEEWYTLTLWYGTTTWETVVLLFGCLIVAWRLRKCRNAIAADLDAAPAPRQAA